MLAGLLAAALLLIASSGATRATSESPAVWSDVPLVQSTSLLHFIAWPRGHLELRQQRRLAPTVDGPVAIATIATDVEAGTSFAFSASTRTHPNVAVLARGYEATAPPAS